MKIKNTFLFLLSFLVGNSILFAQIQEINIPKDKDGKEIVCEKFELLEKTLPYIHLQNNNTSTIPLPPQLQAATRTDEDVQVGDSGTTEFEVHAAINPNDPSNIIVGAMSITGSGAAVQLKFAIYYTNDFGATWQKSPFDGELPNELTVGGGDPMIAFDETGRAYFTWVLVSINLDNQDGTWGMYYATSTNGGGNWIINADPISKTNFTDFIGFSDLSNAVDKQWMVTDHSDNSSYKGNMYIAYVNLPFQDGVANYQMRVKRRLAGNTDFENSFVNISTGNYVVAQFSSIDVGDDGTVYASFFGDTGNNNYGLYIAKSTNGGATFLPEQKVTNISFPILQSGNPTLPGISKDRLYPCPHIAVDRSPNEETIYMTWTAYGIDLQTSNGLDIYISKSTDGGTTWSTPMVVNNDSSGEAHQFYSSIAVNDIGYVFVSWYDQREDVTGSNTHYYLGTSLDGGESFEQVNITSATSDFGQISTSNLDIGPGEYNQIVTTGDYAIPFWGDGRTNDGKIAVYAAFLNVLGVGLEEVKGLNTQFSFKGPQPNPVRDLAIFDLELEKKSNVEVLLFDVLGRKIKTISQREYIVGQHRIELQMSDLPIGEYFVTLNTDFGSTTKKIVKGL